MDLNPSAEQQELATTARRLIERRMPLSGRDIHRPDAAEWAEFAEQGWFGLSLDEACGGFGGGLADEVQVQIELGRTCAPGPVLSTALAGHVAWAARRADIAESIVGGDLRVGIAFGSADDALIAYDFPEAGGALLVVDDVARTFTLVASSAVVRIDALQCIDSSISAARVRLDGEPMLVLDGDFTGDVFLRADLLVAAQLAGIADATAALSVEYAKTRTQFGHPIGSFQAISHRCADMAVRARAAVAAVNVGAATHDDGDDAAVVVAAARIFAQGAALENTRVTIQTHGAIAFTAEHVAHRYLKRARWLAGVFGDRATLTTDLGRGRASGALVQTDQYI